MRNVQQIIIDGSLTDLGNLDIILQEIYEMSIQDKLQIKKRTLGAGVTLQLCYFWW